MQRTWVAVSIGFLTLLSAGSAFLVEANLMQTLSATLGGTLIRYQLGIGFFIVSLGFGSLYYPQMSKKFSNKTILTFSAIGLFIINLLAPVLIIELDQLVPLTSTNPLHWVLYLPILLVGLITGLDLPALIFFSKDLNSSQEQTILGLDYLGMFMACLLFPWLFINFGIFQLSYIVSLFCLLSLLTLAAIPSNRKPKKSVEVTSAKISKTLLAACFLISFCSLSYELILARWMVDFFENEIYAITYTIGFYLMGLGLGALSFRPKKIALQVLKIESILVLSILLIPLISYFAATLWRTYFSQQYPQYIFQFIFLSLVAWVGFWSGRELPLLIHLNKTSDELSLSRLFFFNYLGALASTFVITLVLIPALGVYSSILVVTAINVLALFLFLRIVKIQKIRLWVTLLAITGVLCWAPLNTLKWKQIYLKGIYHRLTIQSLSLGSIQNLIKVTDTISDVNRHTSVYQNIDLVRTELPYSGGGKGDLSLYLNQQPQFSLYSHHLYHDSFAYGSINLNRFIPQSVLILGGGDGLLVNKLLKVSGVKKISMIELDQKVIELSTSHKRISEANEKVFESKKFNLIIGDGFSYLKESSEKFDAVFVDFPYPTNYELSRLYSLEFYQLVRKHLNEDSFIIMNAPFSFSIDTLQAQSLYPATVLVNTLREAGFKSFFPFGAIEPFLFATTKKKFLAFDYSNLPQDLPHRSFVNWVEIKKISNAKASLEVNSIYKPKKVVTW